MADKSKADKASENNLSLAHADIQKAIRSDGELAVIIRQVYNRWPLAKPFLRRMNEIVTEHLNDCDSAAVRIKMELDANRKRNNGKRKP